MCDLPEEELAEYLLWLQAALDRALVRPRPILVPGAPSIAIPEPASATA